MDQGPPPSYSDLQEQGKLIQWHRGMCCLFVSHQWVSTTGADPRGEQLHVLREALRNILAGCLVVQTDIPYFLVFQRVDRLLDDEVSQLAEGYIWFDWFSIPQITARSCSLGAAVMQDEVRRAVDSIPSYVEAADFFVVLCPSLQPAGSSSSYDKVTWSRRGWCRVELLAAMLTNLQARRFLVVTSSMNAVIMTPDHYMFSMPGDGDFAVEADRYLLHDVVEQILDAHIQSLWERSQCEQHRDRARLFTAMRPKFLAKLGTPQQQADSRAASLAHAEASRFKKELHFHSLDECPSTGLSLFFLAAVAGNLPLLRSLASARADVTQRISSTGQQHGVLLREGLSPLFAAVLFNGDPAVVRCLVELKGKLQHKRLFGWTALHVASAAGRLECIDLLLDLRVDLEAKALRGEGPLHMAAMGSQVQAVSRLLEHRAKPDVGHCLGATPLMISASLGDATICSVLLAHRADPNRVAQPQGLWGAISSASLGLSWRRSRDVHGPVYQLAMASGATALHRAAMRGHFGVVRLLLSARADAALRHSHGVSAQEFAERAGHTAVAELLSNYMELGPSCPSTCACAECTFSL